MKRNEILLNILTIALLIAIGIGKNPWPSAIGLVSLYAFVIAERYFHDTFHDENKNAIIKLTAEMAKLKEKQERIDMKAAFGGMNKTG